MASLSVRLMIEKTLTHIVVAGTGSTYQHGSDSETLTVRLKTPDP
jgi:hypothetical protein